jgi:ribonuclease HI
MLRLFFFQIIFGVMMNTTPKIFVWNCRGATNTSFYRYCKQYVDIHKPCLLVIMETRCDPSKLSRTFKLLGFDALAVTEVQGYAGGIAVAWKKESITVDVCSRNFQFMHLKVKLEKGGWWFFTPIYASPIEEKRRLLWNDLKVIASNMNDAWLLAGDFNDIVSADEKRGGAIASARKCNIFKERIDMCNLIDLGAVGPKFTWRGPMYHGGQRIFERLDRALGNVKWRLDFPDGYIKVLTRLEFSDHHPILISPLEAPHPVAPRQFRFESAWLMEESYNDMVRQCWKSESVIPQNLISVEKNIKNRKFQTIDQVLHKKKRILARIAGVQNCIQNGRSSSGLHKLENKLQIELHDILKKEELMWFQRSRAKWLIDGDRNTRYYHLKTISRRKKNNILMLKDEKGQWIDNVDKLQDMATDFYVKLFSEDQLRRDWFQTALSFPVLEPEVISDLAAPITREEVKRAVFNMHPWKAPGPDGFPAGFYQKTWDIVGENVYTFVDTIWKDPSSIGEVNQTDICLIPKISHPEYVKQFRPISLCNTNYKIVTKVIVERLKNCISKLISPFQTGFVPGRNIHENIIVAKEMAHTMHRMKGKKGAFAIKVDLAKAYDKLSWEFIWRVLIEIKFPEVLINVIMHAVTSVMTNVKWNGARSNYFKPQRGIRQGDPISPYLFVLCMDKLSHLILHSVSEGQWHGIRAGRNGPIVSHLMFADDLLLFGEASERQMHCVINTLNQFCYMSGHEVSIDKTNVIFSRNVDRGMRQSLLRISKFKEASDFGRYLGVPLIGRAPKKADFRYILDQVNAKLSAWKASQLSFAGRVTLAKSVIEAVPIYPMMSSKIPKSCLDDIHRMQRQFIWGDTDQKRRFHAVGWDKISVPKWLGGLGLRKLDAMNQACLLKLGWKLQAGSEEYWCSVLRGKYNSDYLQDGGIATGVSSNLWKALVDIKPMLDRFSYWHVGDGRDINAWCDAWIEEGLCLDQHIHIPRQLQGKKVCDLVDEAGRWDWNLFESWMPTTFQQKIAAVLPPDRDNGKDERVGVGGNKRNFSVACMYNNLCGFNKDDAHNLWCQIWKLKVPERVRTFIWMVMHNKLLTNSLKSKMGLSHSMCFYCRVVEETTLHVLRDCTLAKEIWYQVVPIVNRSDFFMGDLQDWIGFNMKNSVMWNCEGVWNVFWAMACYLLWTWRNKELHVEGYMRPNRPVQQVRKMMIEYTQAMQNNNIVVNRSYSASMIGWVPPKDGFVKLNTDGASKNMQQAGCGGIVRGSQGEWIRGYAKSVGMCNAFVAELWGVLEGLRIVKNMGFRKVELCIDSQSVVQVIQNGYAQSSMGGPLLKQIWQLLDHDWNVEISHTYREANHCADALATLGCSLNLEITTFDSCPSHMREIYDADCMGITTSRLITV